MIDKLHNSEEWEKRRETAKKCGGYGCWGDTTQTSLKPSVHKLFLVHSSFYVNILFIMKKKEEFERDSCINTNNNFFLYFFCFTEKRGVDCLYVDFLLPFFYKIC